MFSVITVCDDVPCPKFEFHVLGCHLQHSWIFVDTHGGNSGIFPLGDTVKAVMALSIACCFVGFCKIGVIYKNCAGVNGVAVVVSDRTGDFDRVRCKSGKRKYTSAYSTQKFFLFS